MQKFRVVRDHIGDRPYEKGDVREAASCDVAHLVPHVLVPADADEKAKPEPKNKARKAPENK